MDLNGVMKQAWDAVKESGVPESLQETAFKEAMETLRQQSGAPPSGSASKTTTSKSTRPKARSGTKKPAGVDPADIPSSDEFFEALSSESGVDEKHLRDVLHLNQDGIVRVTTPTKDLGGSAAEQAKSVIALIVGSRAHGLGESPVRRPFVRDELERKHCYQPNNFATNHLGPMKGFNAAGANEIVATSKWVGEFTEAINKALKLSD
jgi:hypothetical protein